MLFHIMSASVASAGASERVNVNQRMSITLNGGYSPMQSLILIFSFYDTRKAINLITSTTQMSCLQPLMVDL